MTDKEKIKELEIEIISLMGQIKRLSDCEYERDRLENQLQFISEARHLQDSHPELFGKKSIIDQQKLEIIFGNGIEKGLYHILSVADLELIKKEWT